MYGLGSFDQLLCLSEYGCICIFTGSYTFLYSVGELIELIGNRGIEDNHGGSTVGR